MLLRRRMLMAGKKKWKLYEPLEYLVFDGTKIFDTGVYGNETIHIYTKFLRTDISGAHYLFGCSSGNRLTGYLSSSGYWRYGSGYPTFNTNSKAEIYGATVTPGKTTVGSYTKSFSFSAFTTAFTIPVGGHKPSSGKATPQFKGYLYYFKMEKDGEVVVDWIPVRRISDGLECFWDKVTEQFVEPLVL